MTLKLDFELKVLIDTIIGNLFEFGLVDMWIKRDDAPTTRALIAAARAKQRENDNGNVVVTIDHIVGALLIMSFGYILAIFAFVLEQIVYRRVRQGTESKFFLYLHKLFRPNRIDYLVTEFSVNNL